MLYDSKQRETYRRARSIAIDNPVDSYPSIRFHEEIAILDEDSVVGAGFTGRNIGQALTEENQADTFDLINPETGDVIGSATYLDFKVMLHSLYLHLSVAPVVEGGEVPEPAEPDSEVPSEPAPPAGV